MLMIFYRALLLHYEVSLVNNFIAQSKIRMMSVKVKIIHDLFTWQRRINMCGLETI